jgi:hypothetical protein
MVTFNKFKTPRGAIFPFFLPKVSPPSLASLTSLPSSNSFGSCARNNQGEYLIQPPTSLHPSHLISFPSSLLPSDPPTRFSELFLTRPKWREEEMKPFLKGLVQDGNGKALDKLVVKFVRVVKEGKETWFFPRRT